MELLIEEFEDVIFPSIDSGIDKIVSVIRGFAYWRVNFQEMRPAQLFELLSHDFAGNGRVIVRCMDEHDGTIRLTHRSQQALANF